MTLLRPPVNDAGFSLLELMVVIFIIGLMASVVMVNLPTSETDIVRETERTQRIMNLASGEAIASGGPVGWGVSSSGHEFRKYRFGKWEQMESGPLSRSDHLVIPRSLSINVISDNRETSDRKSTSPPFEDVEDGDDNNEFKPELVFFPSGETSGVSLSIAGPDGNHRLMVNSAGQILSEDHEL